jgi:multidrug efflux pump subunit AcrA (membrane-fusion protein)
MSKKENAHIQLTSPDGLDQLITATPSKSWFALLGIFLIFISIFVWSFIGRIPAKIHGKGMILKPGGVFKIVSLSSGQLKEITVNTGDYIKKGQIIAFIDQSSYMNQIKYKKAQLAKLQEHYKYLHKTKSSQNDKNIYNVKYTIENIKLEIDNLNDRLDIASKVVSPYTGRVLEILIDEGTFIKQDTPILHLELTGKNENDLEAIIFVSPTTGKRVNPGMKAYISPSTVQREEFGLIIGEVASVSEFPSSFDGMMRVLKNAKLVNTLSEKGAPIEIRVNFKLNSKTVSGYKWTSPKGPPIKIQSGTMCESSITIHEQRPIKLVLPFIKDKFL